MFDQWLLKASVLLNIFRSIYFSTSLPFESLQNCCQIFSQNNYFPWFYAQALYGIRTYGEGKSTDKKRIDFLLKKKKNKKQTVDNTQGNILKSMAQVHLKHFKCCSSPLYGNVTGSIQFHFSVTFTFIS